MISTKNLITAIEEVPERQIYGRVTAVLGMLVEVGGASANLSVGGRCAVIARDGREIACEVIGFRGGRALLMPFQTIDGVGLGCKAIVMANQPVVRPSRGWLGRGVNPHGEPNHGKGPLPQAMTQPLNSPAPCAIKTRRCACRPSMLWAAWARKPSALCWTLCAPKRRIACSRP